ncbi:hypothetical protein QUB47_07805 [Microcoleus sp. AT9_B5]
MLSVLDHKKLRANNREESTPKTAIMVESRNIQEFPSLGSVGLSLRKPIKGVEYNMVKKYVKLQILSTNPEESKAVFLEPLIDSGFPDIVIVYFASEIAKKWSPERKKLNKLDWRILHWMVSEKIIETTKMKTIFPNDLSKSLQRLRDAELIDYKGDTWEAKPLEEIFAIQRLIAIEAKVKNWQEGLQQAFQNTWFASESYLLLPEVRNTNELIQKATRFGVGLLTTECSLAQPKLSPQVTNLPKSYVSWLFNEWAWRASFDIRCL